MPITYHIDHSRRLVDARAHGLLTDEDVFQYQRDVWGRSDVVGYSEIVDMLNVSSVKTESVDRIRHLADLSASMDPAGTHSKFAIVVVKPQYRDLGRIYGAYRELNAKSTKRIRIFGTREDAHRWLEAADESGLPADADPVDT